MNDLALVDATEEEDETGAVEAFAKRVDELG